ncbi:hypothetical protein E2562_033641 [Oryza meyeriana var. granulata]|uniref:F-box domain-containing protein n=1 Tax=Oryza meyeriana var. granulata TaxID=110450 RepID=A0A6G1CAN5_9ORYZ|nr:hypothetical protein E2562_033641 [Oryza meyeriana var. granulata]
MDLDEPQMAISAAAGDGDRLSKLSDVVIGHILSFLPAKEAARAAVLSSRWRHTLAAVHTVSLVEPDGPVFDYEELGRYSPGWYAVKQADPTGLELDLRLRRDPLCHRPYSLRRAGESEYEYHAEKDVGYQETDEEEAQEASPKRARSMSTTRSEYNDEEAYLYASVTREDRSPSPLHRSFSPRGSDDDEEDFLSSDEKFTRRYTYNQATAVQTVPSGIFSCAALRSLSLGSCRRPSACRTSKVLNLRL